MIEQEEGSSDQDDEPYLHPSLASSFTKIEAVCIPRVCVYVFKPKTASKKRNNLSRIESVGITGSQYTEHTIQTIGGLCLFDACE